MAAQDEEVKAAQEALAEAEQEAQAELDLQRLAMATATKFLNVVSALLDGSKRIVIEENIRIGTREGDGASVTVSDKHIIIR